jgi:hypothetical protein
MQCDIKRRKAVAAVAVPYSPLEVWSVYLNPRSAYSAS